MAHATFIFDSLFTLSFIDLFILPIRYLRRTQEYYIKTVATSIMVEGSRAEPWENQGDSADCIVIFSPTVLSDVVVRHTVYCVSTVPQLSSFWTGYTKGTQ